ncbi:hypothetical protein HaLaN_11601, partial [Haematococcus lacustris]
MARQAGERRTVRRSDIVFSSDKDTGAQSVTGQELDSWDQRMKGRGGPGSEGPSGLQQHSSGNSASSASSSSSSSASSNASSSNNSSNASSNISNASSSSNSNSGSSNSGSGGSSVTIGSRGGMPQQTRIPLEAEEKALAIAVAWAVAARSSGKAVKHSASGPSGATPGSPPAS